MLDHHLQRSIVYRLAFEPSLRFSELKPNHIENKLFTYHLKKVVATGFVSKHEDGTYALTPEGRRLGIRVFDKQNEPLSRADSVLFLVVRRKVDNAWLLYRRSTHPLINRVGFMHCSPEPTADCTEVARAACRGKTGLECEFRVLGGGYFRVYEGENLESFTHFTLLICEDAKGDLTEHDKFAEYYWSVDPDFSDPEMIPNMPVLADLYLANKQFFIEKTLKI